MDHGTSGPRNFFIFLVSRKNEKMEGKGIKIEKRKMESKFYVKILQALFIYSHMKRTLGCYQTKEFRKKMLLISIEVVSRKINKICPTSIIYEISVQILFNSLHVTTRQKFILA